MSMQEHVATHRTEACYGLYSMFLFLSVTCPGLLEIIGFLGGVSLQLIQFVP